MLFRFSFERLGGVIFLDKGDAIKMTALIQDRRSKKFLRDHHWETMLIITRTAWLGSGRSQRLCF